MIRKTLTILFCTTACSTAMAFPPIKMNALKLSAEEAARIDVYYQKFSFFDLSRKRLIGEVKGASIGKYADICGDDPSKLQAYVGELFSTEKYEPAISAAIDQTNVQESMIAFTTMLFRDTLKSEETRQHLDQLEVNSTTKDMFFAYVTQSWFRTIGQGPTEIAEKFLQGQCGLKKIVPKNK